MKRNLKTLLSAILSASMVMSMAVVPAQAATSRYMEKLSRGLIAVPTSDGILLSWRLNSTEDYFSSFNIFRDGEYISTVTSTNYLDSDGTKDSTYTVTHTTSGDSATATPFASGSNYVDIPLAPIDDYVAPDGTAYAYEAREISVGDLDGDGEYEFVVKREANHHHSMDVSFDHRIMEAYELDGTVLWRIDCGENMNAMTEFSFLVYDFNCDGIAELAMKTAPGSKDGTGAYVSQASQDTSIRATDDTVSYRDENGKVVSGPEFFTIFDGRNGEALDTIEYPVLRGTNAENTSNNIWGDNYNHRSQKCMSAVAYLDGVNPSIVIWRGIYSGQSKYGAGRTAVAAVSINKSTSRLTVGNRFDTWSETPYSGYKEGNEKYIGQGNHNITVGDIDNDGKDEVISGALCMDDDMSVLWCSYRGHGDALHLGEFDPTNDTLEYFAIHEDGSGTNYNGVALDYGMTLYNAKTGEEYSHISNSSDTARGMIANLGVDNSFAQYWGVGTYSVNSDGTYSEIDLNPGVANFRIYWDGDVYDEVFDVVDTVRNSTPLISDYNAETAAMETLFTASGTTMINSSKNTPLLQADIFGDWREEFIVPHLDHQAVRLYTTNIPTEHVLYTLMSNHVYRLATAWQNQYYVQPPHLGYFITEDEDLSSYDERYTAPNNTIITLTANGSYDAAVDIEEGVLPEYTGNTDYIVDEDGDYYLSHQVIIGGSNHTDQLGSDVWSYSGREASALFTGSQYSDFLANCTDFEVADGKFLVFASENNRYSATFTATNAENPITTTGVLSFDMSMPTTYASYGGSDTLVSRGNDTVTISAGNGLVFTITPTLTNAMVTSAVLSINGIDVHTYETGADAMAWTNVNAYIDNVAGTATVTLTYGDGTTETVSVPLTSTEPITTFAVTTGANYGTLLMDNLTLASTAVSDSYEVTILPAVSAAVGKGSTELNGTDAEDSDDIYGVYNLTSEDTNTLYFCNSRSTEWRGAAVIQFTLPRRDPDSVTGADLYALVQNFSNKTSTRTYYVYAAETNPEITTDFTDPDVFSGNGNLLANYYADTVATCTIKDGATAETIEDSDALLAAVKERMSIDEETTITLVFVGAAQECGVLMNAENVPTLTLEFAEIETCDIAFTTTPYSAVVIDGVEYCTGADGTVTVPDMEVGRTISYTIRKGGYDSCEGTVLAEEGASVEQLIYLSDGYFFYEDFETVPTSDTSDKWDMSMPVEAFTAANFTEEGKFYLYHTLTSRTAYKSIDTITDTICGYKLMVDFSFTDPWGSASAAKQGYISFADENGYVVCGLAYGETTGGSGEYSLYAYADVAQSTAGSSTDIGLDSATLLSEDITSGTLSAYIDYVNDTVAFYIDDVYYTTIAISDEYEYTKTIDSMSIGLQRAGTLTVDNIIVTSYTPENGAIFKVWRQPEAVHVGYCWQGVVSAEDIAAYEYNVNFEENGENIFGRDYVLDFGDDFSGEGDVAFYIFLNGSNAEEKLILTKKEKPEEVKYDLSWTATADVTAGETLMEGLTPVTDLTYSKNSATFSDGVTHAGYITSDTNGKWSSGAAIGTALEFVAPADGTFTVYTKVGSGKTAYIAEEGVSDVTSEYITSLAGTGDYEIVTAEVEAGKTYYAFVNASKANFYGASFTN